MTAMRAVRVHEFGGAERLALDTIDRPLPGPDHLLVKVLAASVNPVDCKTREGRFPPIPADRLPVTLGRDICGDVVAVGEHAEGFSIGDRIFAMLGLFRGGYAEYAVVSAAEAAPAPRSLGPLQAAAVPLAALTAWQGLFDHGRLEPGQRILIHGGAGGVGHFAVQFARIAGAETTTTVSGADLGFARALGAGRAIDYRAEKFEMAGPFDLILDLVGGETQERSWPALRPGGTFVSTLAEPSGERAAAQQARAVRYMTEPDGRQLAEIGRLIDAGRVMVAVDAIFELGQARRAQAYLQGGHPRGKVVLQVAALDV